MTAKNYYGDVTRLLRERRGESCHSTSACVIQYLSGAHVISLVATGIMRNPLFLYGVVLLGMMTISASTVIMVASVASIQSEGNAMADIARAIPGLTTLSGMDR